MTVYDGTGTCRLPWAGAKVTYVPRVTRALDDDNAKNEREKPTAKTATTPSLQIAQVRRKPEHSFSRSSLEQRGSFLNRSLGHRQAHVSDRGKQTSASPKTRTTRTKGASSVPTQDDGQIILPRGGWRVAQGVPAKVPGRFRCGSGGGEKSRQERFGGITLRSKRREGSQQPSS
jgi:hypothetical protein